MLQHAKYAGTMGSGGMKINAKIPQFRDISTYLIPLFCHIMLLQHVERFPSAQTTT